MNAEGSEGIEPTKARCDTAGFEDGDRPGAQACKEVDSLLESLEGECPNTLMAAL